ncbi:hypothetical protein [Streptomyces sirii]|uniref:hypothetical protein n=1 Tax=Streptomyces sirii TaxID=3127701 RepID=UPI003D364395
MNQFFVFHWRRPIAGHLQEFAQVGQLKRRGDQLIRAFELQNGNSFDQAVVCVRRGLHGILMPLFGLAIPIYE